MFIHPRQHHVCKQEPTGPSTPRSVVHLPVRRSIRVHPYRCLCPAQTHHWHHISIYMAILYPRHGCGTPKTPTLLRDESTWGIPTPQGEDRTAPGPQREAGWVPFPKHGWWPKTAPPLAKSPGTFCLLSSPASKRCLGCIWEPSAFCGEAGVRRDAFFPSWKRQKSFLLCQISPEPSSVSH